MVGATSVVSESKVSVVCTCGSRGLFPQRLAGRKIKCRECTQVLRIPAPPVAVLSTDSDEHWLMQDSGDTVVLTPLALCDTDELRVLPAHQRKDWGPSQRPARGLRSSGSTHRGGTGRMRPRRRAGAYDPNVRHHGHVKAIAFWYQAAGVLTALAAVTGAALLCFAPTPGWLAAITLFVGLGVGGLNWGLGYGLSRLHAWGRWIVVALTGINGVGAVAALVGASSLPLLLIGLLPIAWHSAVLWALLGSASKGVFGDYRKTTRTNVPFLWSPFFSIPAVLIALSLALSLVLVASSIVVG